MRVKESYQLGEADELWCCEIHRYRKWRWENLHELAGQACGSDRGEILLFTSRFTMPRSADDDIFLVEMRINNESWLTGGLRVCGPRTFIVSTLWVNPWNHEVHIIWSSIAFTVWSNIDITHWTDHCGQQLTPKIFRQMFWQISRQNISSEIDPRHAMMHTRLHEVLSSHQLLLCMQITHQNRFKRNENNSNN